MTAKRSKKKTPPRQTKAEEREQVIHLVHERAQAQALEFFHDERRLAFATVPVTDHRETWQIRSRDFKLWVMQTLFDLIGRAPKPWVTRCLEEFETSAICRGTMHQVHVRIAERDGVIYVDMGNARWQVIEIAASGWRVLDESPVKFRRPMGLMSLPYPADGGNIRDLLRFLNISPRCGVLFLAWLTHSLRSNLPFPIIAVSGQQGSGKSTITRIARSLIDPSLAPLTTSPRSERDLAIAASNSHLIAMDNLSEISPQLSDAMCRISTGGSFRTRELYTNDSEMIFTYRRPLIVNGIEELPIRGDLLDRSILIHAEPISEDRRRDEETFWLEFEEARPRIFGCMLDIICIGIRRVSGVKLSSTPRMADFARWGVAIEQAMGFQQGSFIAAYAASIADAGVASLDSSPVAQGIYRLITEQKAFHGTTLQLLDTLRKFLERGSTKHPELTQLLRHPKFPRSANQLAGEVSRIDPDLTKLGITIQRGRTHTARYIDIMRTDSDFEARKPDGDDAGVERDDVGVTGKVM
jgi:hypothetical protein